jgi:hypothetical protein
MRHQEGVGEPRKYAQQGGDPIQFRITESDFEFQDYLAFKLMHRTCPTSALGDLHIHGKIRRYLFQCHWSHSQLKSESVTIVKTRLNSRTFLMLHHLFWTNDSCIKLEHARDAS